MPIPPLPTTLPGPLLGHNTSPGPLGDPNINTAFMRMYPAKPMAPIPEIEAGIFARNQPSILPPGAQGQQPLPTIPSLQGRLPSLEELGANHRGTLGAKVKARRPMRGLQIKTDTYASLRIIKTDGSPIMQIDAAGQDENPSGIGRSFVNTNFIAQQISEERAEKSQIVETFGEPFVFFFGERPRVITVQGLLINTVDFNWRAEWWDNYDKLLRGTKLVEARAKLYLCWDDICIGGYMLQAKADDIATDPYRIPFGFAIFLTEYFNVGIRGNPLLQTGVVNPLERMKGQADGLADKKGKRGFFATLFSPESQEKINTFLNLGLSVVENPTTAALGFIQGATSSIANRALDDANQALQKVLRGGGNVEKPNIKAGLGPLRNNYDEFLNSEFDRFDSQPFASRGMDDQSFTQKLINLVPGLNNPQTLGRVMKLAKRHKNTGSMVPAGNKAVGERPFHDTFKVGDFLDGSSSSPFLDKNILRLGP